MSAKIKVIITLLIVVCFMGGTYYFASIALRFERVEVEAERIPSPNKLYDSILIESNAGATTPIRTLIYIKLSGEKVSKDDYIIFGADRVVGRKIYWKDDNTLRIEYESAKIFLFRNYCTFQINDKYQEINIEEICMKIRQ